jgi:hypothetical protein
MFRFLKWTFLILGTLGLLIMIFFYSQNRQDLHLYYSGKDSLSYDTVKENCPQASNEYYFKCFIVNFKNYLEGVSLTGTSLGLKSAFTFIDEDKINNKSFEGVENDVRFALNHLKLNNLALVNATKRFHGFEFTYGGYIGKISDFNERANDFSIGIIEGLKSDSGIKALPVTIRDKYSIELQSLEFEFFKISKTVQAWLDLQISELKDKHQVD